MSERLFCLWCGKFKKPKHYPCGRTERLKDMAKRKFCNQRCMGDFQHWKAGESVPERYCLYCAVTLERKRFPSKSEAVPTFAKRKFCSLNCYNSYRKHKRDVEKAKHPWKYRCRLEGCNMERVNGGMGYCGKHYRRLWVYGDPMLVKRRDKDGKYQLVSAI